MMRHHTAIAAGLTMGLVACAPPDTSSLFNDIDLAIAPDAPSANTRFIDAIDAAEVEVRLALSGLTDLDLADALIDAANGARGLEVEVVVDFDSADDAGVVALLDAGVPVSLADAGITYFDFGLNTDVVWPSEETVMTHAFVVVDGRHFVMSTAAGDLSEGERPVFFGTSEELAEDLIIEHNQVFGGSDATSVTAFDATAKSVADDRWIYATQSDEFLEVWFNPQERAVKRVIDAVYRAKSSVRIMTHDFADEGLARALQAKAADGFDVEVLVGAGFQSASAALSDVLLEQAVDVPVLQTTSLDPLPTIAFIDYDKAPDGRFHMPMAMMITHPIWSAARLFNEREVLNDQLVDGALYVMSRRGSPSQPLQDLAELYQLHRQDAEAVR